jgi:hypothetical protein
VTLKNPETAPVRISRTTVGASKLGMARS